MRQRIKDSSKAYHAVASLNLAGATVYLLQLAIPTQFAKYACSGKVVIDRDVGKLIFFGIVIGHTITASCVRACHQLNFRSPRFALIEAETVDALETVTFALLLSPVR